MGYSISWLAVRKESEPQLLQHLGLARTGERENVPESDLIVVDLPSGWFLLWSNDMLFAQHAIQQLANLPEIITCAVEEHVNYCEVACYKHGEQTWSVTHDAQLSLDHLDVKGNPPDSVGPIRDRILKEQQANAEVDSTFSIPIELAKTITGFTYDGDVPDATEDDEPFEVVEVVSDGYLASNPRKTGCFGVVGMSSILCYIIWSVA